MSPAKGKIRAGGFSFAKATPVERIPEQSPTDDPEPVAATSAAATPIHGRESGAASPTTAPLADLVANPRNPRATIRDIHKLASIVDIQLQPCLVVSRTAYLALRPGDVDEIGDALWVVINGNRRLAAAREYGRAELDIVVKDEVAASEQSILAASILENVDREGFDIIDEAYAVRAMIEACGGRQDLAAEKLHKKPTWVSYHKRLPDLLPELQETLRAGEMTQEIARQVAAVPQERQIPVWEELVEAAEEKRDADRRAKLAERQKAEFTAVNQDSAPADPPAHVPASFDRVRKVVKRLDATPSVWADVLREVLGEDGVKAVVTAWESGSRP